MAHRCTLYLPELKLTQLYLGHSCAIAGGVTRQHTAWAGVSGRERSRPAYPCENRTTGGPDGQGGGPGDEVTPATYNFWKISIPTKLVKYFLYPRPHKSTYRGFHPGAVFSPHKKFWG